MLGDGPGEQAVLEFLFGRRALCHDLERVAAHLAIVAALHQHAACDALDLKARTRRIGQVAGQQQAEILLLREDGLGRVIGVGRGDDFGEDAADRFGGGAVERAVDRDDAAKGRDAVAGERGLIGFDQRVAGGDAAGIGVLDDDDGRRAVAKFADQLQRGVGVVVIIVGEFLALDLLRLSDAARGGTDRQIEGGGLMRIFAIAQRRAQRARQAERFGEGDALVCEGEPAGDHRIIGGGGGISLGREHAAEVVAGRATLFVHFGDQPGIVGGIGDDRDAFVILRGGADHGGAANVDILDNLLAIRALGDGGGEGIEIDDDKIDRADGMLVHRGDMIRVAPHGEQAAMDLGM